MTFNDIAEKIWCLGVCSDINEWVELYMELSHYEGFMFLFATGDLSSLKNCPIYLRCIGMDFKYPDKTNEGDRKTRYRIA